MTALAEAFVSVRADTSKVKGDVEKGFSGAKVTEHGKKLGKTFMAGVLGGFSGAALAQGLGGALRGSIDAFKEAQGAQARLSDAFSKFPKLADISKKSLQDLNTELAKKTKFDDDATASGQSVLAQFRLTGTQITQLTPLLQDYAAKTGKDLPTAAKDLGKAVLGNGKALKNVGLNFKDTGTATGNFTQLVGGLRTQVGGFAEKEGATAAGKTEILKNQFGELQETLGSKLLPIMQKATAAGLQVVDWIQRNSAVMKPLLIGLAVLIPAIYALNLALSLNPISLVVIGLAALGAALFVAYRKSETFRNIVNGVFAAVKVAVQAWWAVVSPILSALAAAFKFIWERGQEFGRILGALWPGVKEAFRLGAKFIWEKLRDAFSLMLQGAEKAFGWVPGLGGKLRTAKAEFDTFAEGVNKSLDGIDDEAIKVALQYTAKGVNLTAPSHVSRTGLALGGSVSGPGSGTSDSAGLFALSNGEHVLTAREVRGAGGHSVVEAIRAKWRGMASGGAVGLHVVPSLPDDAYIGAVSSAVALQAGKDIARLTPTLGAAGPPGSVRSFRGQTLNERTIRMLLAAEGMLGAAYRIMQGSYSTRVAASGGTHSGGGAMDTDGPRGWSNAVGALRRAGFAAWHRTPSQGPWGHHIHSIAIGDPTASPSAKRQVQSFLRGGNGLGGMWRGGPVSFDGGGWLQPGLTLAHNGTGRPEPVGGGVTVQFTNCTFAGTGKAQFTDLVVSAVDEAKRKRRL